MRGTRFSEEVETRGQMAHRKQIRGRSEIRIQKQNMDVSKGDLISLIYGGKLNAVLPLNIYFKRYIFAFLTRCWHMRLDMSIIIIIAACDRA